MKYFLLVIVLVFLISCHKEDLDSTLPPCINEIIQSSLYWSRVESQIHNGQQVYWLKSDVIADVQESIINNQCEILCSYCGECEPARCAKKYKNNKWETIWER